MGTPSTRSYRDLIAWQKAMQLVELTYRLTDSFPIHERYKLAAFGSGAELETQLEIATRLTTARPIQSWASESY
jgi:hypothetical protein